MSTAKHYLKLAKGAIQSNDPELALEYVQDVLEADKNNYLAFIFQGKSYQLLNQLDNAVAAFKKATTIDPSNILGWRGYFQVVRAMEDYELFFDILAKYIKVQIDDQQPLGDTLRDMTNYLFTHNFKTNSSLHETYLKSIIPGSQLHELVGHSLGKPESSLRELIDLLVQKQQDLTSNLMMKERIRLPKQLNSEQKEKLNRIVWPVYEETDVSQYFDEFLNICDDKALRVEYQEKYLKYKYNLLTTSPSSMKNQYLHQVKQMAEDLVLIRLPSLFVWTLYLELKDMKDFYSLDKDEVLFIIEKFHNEGLGILLYGLLNSEISPFDKSILKLISFREPKAEEQIKDDDEVEGLEADEEIISDTLLPEQTLALMLEGYSKCKESVLANRIIVNYYIHLREYLEASEKCKEGIRVLADLNRSLGIELPNSKEDVICSLAVVYTYHEAPKNFSRALDLYERVLETSKSNKRARIGKGLILMEKGELQTANDMLHEVHKEYPEDPDVLMELGWCEIQLSHWESGDDLLNKALGFLKGVDIQSCELRAKILWRLAKSLLDRPDQGIQKPYDLLIQSLNEFKNFAPSYTSLGLIYLNHYKDKPRSQKCFYKAFELDSGEVISARNLVEELATKKEWEIAEILCIKVVETERSRRALSLEPDKAWPYRVLGCSALNKQDDAKAIEWFQTALRMESMDFECWVGLGEAYYNCGKVDAAQKVFERALTIKDSWMVIYMLGKVLCDTKEFEKGIETLESALQLQPNEQCVINAIFQAKLTHIDILMEGGYFGRVLHTNLQVVTSILQACKIEPYSESLWISLNKSLNVFLTVQNGLDSFPITEVESIFKCVESIDGEDPLIAELKDELDLESVLDLYSKGKHIESICSLIIFSCKVSIRLFPNKGRYIKSGNYYNLGLAYYQGYKLTGTMQSLWRDLAIKCLKKAIQLEGKNANFWVSLGNVYSTFNPQISQHCFIKAMSLESRDGDIWNNLAALYLKYGDVELAQETYLRSQSVAPEQSQPWLGHALAAKANGDYTKSNNLFTHAFILANGKSPLAQLLYAMSIIDKRITNTNSDPRDISTAQEFGIANFAIHNYLKYYPTDKVGLKVALTISERCKSFETSKTVGSKLLGILEAEYEETESETSLEEFIGCKCQMARIYLATGDYDEAIDQSQMVLDLCDEDVKYEKYLLSTRVTIGLGYFFKKDLNSSLNELKQILSQYNESSTLITLTAQVLNAFGTEETKQAALDQLFTFIEENGSCLMIILTLGAIALTDDLTEYLPAIKEELNQLSLKEIVQDSFKTVPRMLDEINTRLQQTNNHIWQKTALLFPNDFNVWKHISDEMALSIANSKDTQLNSHDMAQAYLNVGKLKGKYGRREVQRGIILFPGFNKSFTI